MTALRWYQTTWSRVYAIASAIGFFVGLLLLALVQIAPSSSGRAGDVARGVVLVLLDVLRRLHRLERRR